MSLCVVAGEYNALIVIDSPALVYPAVRSRMRSCLTVAQST